MEDSLKMLAFPVRFVNGAAAVVERDSAAEIAQSVEIVVRTRRGQRLERPEFGILPLEFSGSAPAASAEHVRRSIIDADDRAIPIVEAETSDLQAMMLRIGVTIEEVGSGG